MDGVRLHLCGVCKDRVISYPDVRMRTAGVV